MSALRSADYQPLPSPADHELVLGPVHGYHLACYVVETHDGHIGYVKLVPGQRPSDVWDTPAARAKVAAGPFDDPVRAIATACARAEQLLACGLLRPLGGGLA